ncbi:MAG: ThiF family adenylyltransferase [Bryobacteraceae bacterium]
MSGGELDRYSRQIRFEPIGERGQAAIRAASVCIIGCGALGSFQAESLARAGIGTLGLIDRDYVDLSNLQRQWLYEERDARDETPKAVAAARRIAALNRDVQAIPAVSDVTPSNIEELTADYDLLLDGTDNFETRYLLNDLSVKRGVPWIYGAAIGAYGVVMPVVPGRGPCFRCIYPEAPTGALPTCDVNGIISPTTATVAAWQVSLALRLLVGWNDFVCRIQNFDVWAGRSHSIAGGERDPGCPVCGKREFSHLDGQRTSPVSLCGRNAVQLHNTTKSIDLQELAVRLRALGEVRVNEFALRVSVPKYDVTLFADGRAIVKGTTDVAAARSIYAQLIGT